MLGPDIDATLDVLVAADRLRFANQLRAWADFDAEGNVVGAGHLGGSRVGATNVRVGTEVTLGASAMPERRGEVTTGPGWIRFTQTNGGRTGAPMPRATRRAPFVQFKSPVAWSTLELTLHADGRCEGKLVGASPFPRHWVYDTTGALIAKSGNTDWKGWAGSAFGTHTPWGDEDSPAFVTAAETALERELSGVVMRGAGRPAIRKLKVGQVLTRQGDVGNELFLVLDGVLVVDVDGTELAEIGPGAVLGERAVLERWTEDVDADGEDAVQGRCGARRTARRSRAWASWPTVTVARWPRRATEPGPDGQMIAATASASWARLRTSNTPSHHGR